MKSRFIIEVDTVMKKQIIDNVDYASEDFTEDLENLFHNSIRDYLDYQITENGEFEKEIIEIMQDKEDYAVNIEDFSNLGEIKINIFEDASK